MIKKLSANDNSKNQIYLGGHEAIQLLPSVETTLSKQTSLKKKAEKFIFKNSLNFYWLNNDGPHKAKNAKLIYYPQYPETRFSGFLQGCKQSKISNLFDEKNKLNFPERFLLLSSNIDNESFGYVLIPSKEDKKSLDKISTPIRESDETFLEVFIGSDNADTREELFRALRRIHKQGWIPSCRLNKMGVKIPYKAQNGGGYTLEAELGIIPNGDAEPDYLGWEIKQHSCTSKIITLLTPEPDSGLYNDKGVESFLKKYGYKDKKGRDGRINFGGIYRHNNPLNPNTNLSLKIEGFSNGNFTSENGFIGLFNASGKPVAKWTFSKLLEHWSRKHAKTAFLKSQKQEVNKIISYRYLDEISLGIGTSFISFLTAVESGLIYLDPAIKLETLKDGKTKTKARNQFRVHVKNLRQLYKKFELTKI